MMIKEGLNPKFSGIWLPNGGNTTLYNYNTQKVNEDYEFYDDFDEETFKKHIEWMKTLPICLEYEDIKDDKGCSLLVTHSAAGNVWEHKGDEYDNSFFEFEVLWTRNENPRKIEGVYNVFGHTPQKLGPLVKQNFACIDTGSCFSKEAGLGKLTALQFPQMIVYEQENID